MGTFIQSKLFHHCPSQICRLPGPDDGGDAHFGEGQLQLLQPPPRGRRLLPPQLGQDLLLLRCLHVVLAVPDEDEVPRGGGRGGGGRLGLAALLSLLGLVVNSIAQFEISIDNSTDFQTESCYNLQSQGVPTDPQYVITHLILKVK